MASTNTVLEPAARLLWAACRLEPATTEVTAAIGGGADLAAAARYALVQRVSPLFLRALDAAGATPDDAAWVAHLRNDAARCRARSAIVLPRLGPDLLRPLSDADLTPLVLKGAALADRYPAPGLRPMDDVDILAGPKTRLAVVAALRRAGWLELPPHPVAPEIVMTHPELPGLPLEVHDRVSLWWERANRLTADWLWARRLPATLHGAPAFGLSPEVELLNVAAHAAKPFHTFSRMLWIVDVAVIVSAARGFDWEVLAREAHDAGCLSALAITLTHAARIGVDSPVELRTPPARGSRAAALRPLLRPTWPLEERDERIRRRAALALADDVPSRVQMLVGTSVHHRRRRAAARIRSLTAGRRSGDRGNERVHP